MSHGRTDGCGAPILDMTIKGEVGGAVPNSLRTDQYTSRHGLRTSHYKSFNLIWTVALHSFISYEVQQQLQHLCCPIDMPMSLELSPSLVQTASSKTELPSVLFQRLEKQIHTISRRGSMQTKKPIKHEISHDMRAHALNRDSFPGAHL